MNIFDDRFPEEEMSDSSDRASTGSDDSMEFPFESLGLQKRAAPPQTAEKRRAMEDDSDESDVESHDSLLRMSKNFTDKIKEKNDTIKIYKKVLLNTQLQLVKREAAHQRTIRKLVLGGQIKKLGEENRRAGVPGNDVVEENGGNGRRNALSILPEEIWLMILEYVTDVKDIRNCSKVCRLFERLLDETKSQWLYGKIFPLVFNYLRRKDVLNCRGVCKRWRLGTDNFLESYNTLIQPEKDSALTPLEDNLDLSGVNLNPFHFEYHFSIPPSDLDASSSDDDEEERSTTSNGNHDKVREKMALYPRNPFIGRSVTLDEKDSPDVDAAPGEFGLRTFVSEAKVFLDDFGRHIWHLTICCNMDVQTPSQFYDVCLKALSECSELKSLCLGADLNWRVQRSADLAKINGFPPPVDHSDLEALQVDVDNKRIFVIQDKLIGKYSNQLKRLEVNLWNSEIYSNYQWSVLRELQVNKSNANELLQSLKKMKAPNLQKLVIRLDGKGPYLQTLLELTHRFPKLSYLVLKIESRFGGMSEDELMNLPPGLTSSTSLTTLELTTAVTDILSYNFLMYFPFLRKLLIRHGHWTNYNLLDAAVPYFQHLQEGIFKSLRKSEVVKIAKYVLQNSVQLKLKCMYKSNVWGMLPFLQVLELRNARFIPEKTVVYTRKGYEYFVKSQKDDKPE